MPFYHGIMWESSDNVIDIYKLLCFLLATSDYIILCKYFASSYFIDVFYLKIFLEKWISFMSICSLMGVSQILRHGRRKLFYKEGAIVEFSRGASNELSFYPVETKTTTFY